MSRRTLAGLGLVLAGLLARPAAAQYPDINGTTTNSFPGFLFAQAQNRYLRIRTALPGIVQTINPGGGTTAPTFVGYSNYRGGRLLIDTIAGDPFTTVDDGISVTAPTPYSCYSTITLGDRVTPDSAEADLRTYEFETLFRNTNNPTQDIRLTDPAVSGNTISYSWMIREGHASSATIQQRQLTTTNPAQTGAVGDRLLIITQSYTLVRDMVRVQVEVLNVSEATQVVGIETYLDGSFGGARNDGTEFLVDGVSRAIETEFLFPSASGADEAALRRVPGFWRTFDNQRNPGVVLGGLFSGADISSDPRSAGPPDQAMFVNAGLAGNDAWGYTPVRLNLVGEDWGVKVRWNNQSIAPNATRRFITYFGLAGANSDFTSPYVLSVEAPFSLELATGDDPATTISENPDHVYRTPNPFTLRAFVNNISTRAINNVALSLALPPGFALATPGDTATKSVATVPAGGEAEVSWQLRSLTTQMAGNQTLTVTASGSGIASKLIEREIGIPALPTLEFPSLTNRLDMISVPYDFRNRDVENVLGSLGSIGVTGGGAAAVARYNPAARRYAFFPDAFVTSVEPGHGMWLFNGALTDLVLPADRFEIPTNQTVTVALTPSWNQIGCPFTVPSRLYDTEVVTEDNVTRTFDQAVNAGIIRPVIYEYLPNQTDPGASGSYTFAGDTDTTFRPWRGYWIRTLENVSLVYQVRSFIGPFRGEQSSRLALDNGWELELSASTGGQASQTVQLGQDVSSRDGYDLRDLDLPPTARSRDYLRLGVVNDDWGRNSGVYLRDIKGPGRQVSWSLLADCDQPDQEVNLSWNLRGVPGDVQLTLVDLQTGARRHMRTTSGYRYLTGPFGGARQFVVEATRQSRGPVMIPHMQAGGSRSGGLTVTFLLSREATVDVVIESPTGRRVRTVQQGLEGRVGQNSVVWDGRDDARRPVPSGQYRCRVLAHTPEGQQAVAERMIILSR